MQEFRFELELTSPVVTQVEVTASEQEAEIRYVGIVGPQGEDGDAGLGGGGTAQLIQVTAGETISGDMLVMRTSAVLKNDPIEANAYKCLGFATAAVTVGQELTVTIAGLHESAGWGLTPGAVYYAAANGGITTTPPAAGLSQVVGVAVDANTMYVDLNDPIVMI